MYVGESLPLLRRAYDEAGESQGHYEAYLNLASKGLPYLLCSNL